MNTQHLVGEAVASTSIIKNQLIIRHLGLVDYEPVWLAMQRFTHQRDALTVDELWWVQHRAVFTQGQAGKPEHVISPGDIPVVQVDRGGQVTYHGPGQLIGYLLINLKRRGLGVRSLVSAMEHALIAVLSQHAIGASARKEAPGVYVDSGAKIAQLGLRVRRGCSFHGLSLNVNMDLTPFRSINPCGYRGLAVTSMQQETGVAPDLNALAQQLSKQLCAGLGYTARRHIADGVLPA